MASHFKLMMPTPEHFASCYLAERYDAISPHFRAVCLCGSDWRRVPLSCRSRVAHGSFASLRTRAPNHGLVRHLASASRRFEGAVLCERHRCCRFPQQCDKHTRGNGSSYPAACQWQAPPASQLSTVPTACVPTLLQAWMPGSWEALVAGPARCVLPLAHSLCSGRSVSAGSAAPSCGGDPAALASATGAALQPPAAGGTGAAGSGEAGVSAAGTAEPVASAGPSSVAVADLAAKLELLEGAGIPREGAAQRYAPFLCSPAHHISVRLAFLAARGKLQRPPRLWQVGHAPAARCNTHAAECCGTLPAIACSAPVPLRLCLPRCTRPAGHLPRRCRAVQLARRAAGRPGRLPTAAPGLPSLARLLRAARC